jgi:hypothetical protein
VQLAEPTAASGPTADVDFPSAFPPRPESAPPDSAPDTADALKFDDTEDAVVDQQNNKPTD